MKQRVRLSIFAVAFLVFSVLMLALPAEGQETLGGITGTVTDSSGAVIADVVVTLVGDQTNLTRTQKTNCDRRYTTS